MAPRIFGDHPLARDEKGHLKTRIGTVFPNDNVLVMLPGISHMMQREAYTKLLDEERIARGEPPMDSQQRAAKWFEAVDLIMERDRIEHAGDQDEPEVEDRVLIRPDPDRMPLSFAADELLRELSPPIPVWQIRFQTVRNSQVHEAIKLRGQCWRMTPLPQSTVQMKRMITTARTKLGGRAIYYYNKTTGTRLLTCATFAQLGDYEVDELRQHLAEIQKFCSEPNGQGNPEIGFFLAGNGFSKRGFAGHDFSTMPPDRLTATYRSLVAKFRSVVPVELQHDTVDDETWRGRMFEALIGERDEVVTEETMLGLSSEFYMQIEWLPGARIDSGELLVDPCFQEQVSAARYRWPCDEKTLGFIFNFVREFGGLEYVNIGKVIGSMSRGRRPDGRRDVYVAVLKTSDDDQEIVKIIRMQKRGVREHLDDGEELLQAVLKSDGYTDFVLDRRLACRQLGMNLTQRILARKVNETYQGKQTRYHGMDILSPYFERDYIHGIATDKIPPSRFQKDSYACQFATLLGRAAAPNMIVGRCDRDGGVVFDDGDELVLETADGLPEQILLSDQMGTFRHCTTSLADFARAYAEPVNSRLKIVPDPAAFAAAYLDGFQTQFSEIQQHYGSCRSAYDALFRHRHLGPGSNIALRWVEVLRRLDSTYPNVITEQVRSYLDESVQ